MSKVSWPPKGLDLHKLEKKEESTFDVFDALLTAIANSMPNPNDRLKWRERFKKAHANEKKHDG